MIIMALFGSKKYSFNRGNVAKTTSNWLKKGADVIASFDDSGKTAAQKIEEICARVVNDEEDTKLIMARLRSKFGIDDIDMIIIPQVNDSDLLIEAYVLAVPNTQNVLTPAVSKKDAAELINYLTTVALTQDDNIAKGFFEAIEKALNSK
jgi:hypothetical protein